MTCYPLSRTAGLGKGVAVVCRAVCVAAAAGVAEAAGEVAVAVRRAVDLIREKVWKWGE